MPTWNDILTEIRDRKRQGNRNPFDRVRRKYLKELNRYTDRGTILYSTRWTEPSVSSPLLSISNDDVHSFMEVIHGIETEELDLILHSPGGSPVAAEQIVSYLRAKFSDIRMIVPQAAMSAATLMCCAADEVVMGVHSSLGPIDPQMSIQTQMGPQTKPAHAILDQFHKASEEIGNNSDLLAWLPTLQQYTPGTLAECEEAIDLSRSLAKEWSYEYMHREEDQSDRESLSESLADFLGNREKFKSHGRRISIDQANNHGFATVKLENDQKLQDLVLSVFHATIHTHTGRGIDKIIENHDGRSVLKTRTVKEGQGSNPDHSQSG